MVDAGEPDREPDRELETIDGRIQATMDRLAELVFAGEVLNESIDMRIHYGGRKLIDEIYEWKVDVEHVIQVYQDAQTDGDEFTEADMWALENDYDLAAAALERLRERVRDAAAPAAA